MEGYYGGWGDDESYPDPDYGIWGDADCEPMPIRQRSEKDKAEIARLIKREKANAIASHEFNLYMIELFNEARK